LPQLRIKKTRWWPLVTASNCSKIQATTDTQLWSQEQASMSIHQLVIQIIHQAPPATKSRDCKNIIAESYGHATSQTVIQRLHINKWKTKKKKKPQLPVEFPKTADECRFSWLNDWRRLTRSSFNDSGIWEIKVLLASAINNFLHFRTKGTPV
jgi:hypothetical protein